ncbi:MAG: DegT/DnrJ/EryC1/StrS aminotransferase family protein [Endomicrobiia bacterium]
MILHSKPTITGQEIKLIQKVLDSNQLTQDGFVKKFEQKISLLFEKRFSVCVSSGSTALHLLLKSLGIQKNDEVIIPAYTCSALLYSVLNCGAKPVIVDVNYDDMNISYEDTISRITKKTKAIIVPHMFGFPAKDIKKLLSLKIAVIEDCAQSVGAKIFNKPVGSFTNYGITSFYGTKMLTSGGEGGAVFSNSKDIYKKIIQLRNYDKTMESSLKYNYKMTELQAAFGISQIEKIKSFILRRKKIAQVYTNELKNCNIELPKISLNIEPVFYRYVIRVNPKTDLDKTIEYYMQKNVQVARPLFMPLDKLYYKKYFCKNSMQLHKTSISLPIYPMLEDFEIEKIIKITKNIFG